MIVIAGMWELGWNTPIKEIDPWYFVLREFEVDAFHMVPFSGIKTNKVVEMDSLGQVIVTYPDLVPVFVAENGDTDLQDFNHPKNALYIFGRTNYSPFNNMKTNGSQSIKVTTKANKGLLFGPQAAVIILYDRIVIKCQ
jgi:hypothetical protein